MAGKLAGRRKYVVMVCGAALLAGLGLLGGRMILSQYRLAHRQQIMATATEAYEQGVLWMLAEGDTDPIEQAKQRLVNSHPAYALGFVFSGLAKTLDASKHLICPSEKIVVTATMASCTLPTGLLKAESPYVLYFTDHPMPPTKFNASNIPLEPNGVPDLHPSGLPLSHYLGFSYSNTGPDYAKDADYMLKLLTTLSLRDVPMNGVWTKPNLATIDARSCYASQGRNSLAVMCFWEG